MTQEWHITQRGARRLLLHQDTQDYETFYRIFRSACRKTEVTLISHALMSNHDHLQARGIREQVSECMWLTNKPYADYFNDRYGLTGHVFEGPFHCKEIRHPLLSVIVSRYIHLNPVRAGLTSNPESYPWSSCGQYFRDTLTPAPCLPNEILARFSDNPVLARDRYRRFVFDGLRRPVVKKPHESTASELWREQFQWVIESVQRLAWLPPGLSVYEISILWATGAGIPPRAIASVLGLPSGKQVSDRARQLRALLAKSPELNRQFQSLDLLATSWAAEKPPLGFSGETENPRGAFSEPA